MKFISIICVILLLAGCASSKHTINNYDPNSVYNQDASVKIAEAATSISHSLSDLREIEKTEAPPINSKYLPYPTSSDLYTPVSVDWSGPIEEFAQRAAHASDYTLRVIGVRPAIPILITITAKNTPLSYVLRDANFQAGSKASIMVYPAIHVIELRYGKA